MVTKFSLRGGGGTLALYTEDTIKCSNSKCEKELFTQAQDYITLSSCNHSLCVMCFATQVASAGCNNYITCPCSGCKQPSNSYTVHDVVLSKKRTESIVLPSIVEKQFVIAGPDKEMDPIRYYQEQTKNTKNTSFFSLTLATSSKSNNRLQFITNTGIFLYKRSSEWGDELISVLEIIFKTMHGCLITHDPLSMQYNPFSFPTEASIDRAVENDRSPLHRCLFALSYGQTIKSVSNNTNLGKKRWNALMKKAFCITDLCRNLRTKHDGFVSSLVSKHVTAQDTPGNVPSVLQMFGLSSLAPSLRRKQQNEVDRIIVKGIDYTTISKYDYEIHIFDNLGHFQRTFSKDGGKVGYVQSTQRLIIRVTREQATKWGLYYDPSNPERVVLSRDTKKWREVLDSLMDTDDNACPGKNIGTIQSTN